VLDSGLHQVLARRYFKVFAAGGLIMPTDLQSMGFAIPTAIGARMAVTRPVVALLGDGGFAMTGLELLTAVREKVPMVAIVFVDGALGQIRMQQLADYGTAYGVSLRNPDLRLFAEAIGARYELIDDANLDSVLGSALESADVTIVEVRVGDTLRIISRAAMIRTSEATRRIAPLRFTRFLRWLFRRR
jgi:acetolactate synthase-1/2/3 large subunit